jgi:hypothetical protein
MAQDLECPYANRYFAQFHPDLGLFSFPIPDIALVAGGDH